MGWKQLTVAVPPSIVQDEYHFTSQRGIKLLGIEIDFDLEESFGTYYVYFDDLRAVTDLFADSDMVAFVDQPGQVVLDGVMGDPCQRCPYPLPDRARGQNDIELPGDDLSILIECFVKIPQTEEQQSVWVFALDLEILLTDGGDVLGHAPHCMISNGNGQGRIL